MSSLTSLSTGEMDPEEPELGVLMTGGRDSTSSPLSSAEFYGSEICYVPALPEPRTGHITFLTPNGFIATCGGWTEASTTSEAPTPQLGGVVTSPNYPGDYPNDLDKTFTIEGSPGKMLQMTFVDLDIEESYDYDYETYDYDYDSPSCDYDWLQVTARTCSYLV